MKVAIDGVELWFDVDGAGLVVDGTGMAERRTVIALHGGPGYDHTIYKPDLQILSERVQIVFLDQRGHGRSGLGNPAQWNIDQWADDVAAFCAALDIRRPILFGQSFGGFVALAAAIRHPDLASGLIVLSSAAHVEREAVIARFAELGGTQAGDAARAFIEHPGETSSALFGQHCFPLFSRKDASGLMSKVGRAIFRSDVQNRFFRPGGEFGAFDYRPGLERCHTPTLMIHGELDPIIPVSFARDTAARFPPGVARLVALEDAAHDVLGDRWDDVYSEMVSFIDGIDRREDA